MPKWAKEIQESICQEMNKAHHELVLGFVQQLANQKDAISAEMVGIDGDGIRLIAHTVHGDERLMLPFRPPLNGPNEVKERVQIMAQQLK